jgi:photosystem II stability/assembly factor-like uncharacterized protein
VPQSTDKLRKSRPQRRREASRRRTRRRQQRLLTRLGVVVLAALVLLVAWWVIGRSAPTGGASGTALYQFDTADFHSLAFDPEDADLIYFGHHHGLKASHDGGRSWRDTNLQGVDAMQLAMPVSRPNRRYVAGHEVFVVSDDGGATWQPQPNNLPNLDLHYFAGSLSDHDRLYAIPIGSVLWTSADGGATWTEAIMPPIPDTHPIGLAVSPDDSSTVYLARGGQIATSVDGGMTWRLSQGPEAMITSLAVANDSSETVYAGTNQGLMRRNAEGIWQRLPIEPDGFILAVAVSPVQPERIAILDEQGNLYRSDDGGQTWADN